MLQATENDLEQAEILVKHCQGTGEIERKIAERFAELRAEREIVEKKAYDDGQRSMCSTTRIKEFLLTQAGVEVYIKCLKVVEGVKKVDYADSPSWVRACEWIEREIQKAADKVKGER